MQGEVDHNMRQRFGVTRDDENFVVRQRVRVIADQLALFATRQAEVAHHAFTQS